MSMMIKGKLITWEEEEHLTIALSKRQQRRPTAAKGRRRRLRPLSSERRGARKVVSASWGGEKKEVKGGRWRHCRWLLVAGGSPRWRWASRRERREKKEKGGRGKIEGEEGMWRKGWWRLAEGRVVDGQWQGQEWGRWVGEGGGAVDRR